MVMKSGHCSQATELLAGLDAELAANGKRRGQVLSWSAAENELRDQLANLIDRRQVLQRLWAKAEEADDAKIAVKCSVEIRQIGKDVKRLLEAIKTDAPAAKTLTSIKAANASNTRWARERARNAAAQ